MAKVPEVQNNSRHRREDSCPFCSRRVPLTFHHLIPKKMHRRPRFARSYDKETLNLGIYICRDCHKGVHAAYDEMQLATRFSSPEALLGDAGLQRHFRWVARQRRGSTDAQGRV